MYIIQSNYLPSLSEESSAPFSEVSDGASSSSWSKLKIKSRLHEFEILSRL